jgi:UDP-glucose 4-epimerase
MRAVLENKPVLIYGDGNQQRAFSYIDDILPSIWNAAEKKEASKQIIHLGGPEPISINEAALTLEKVVGSSLNIQHKEPRHEVKDAWCTTEKSEKILDYQYKINLEIGLKSMWNWAQEEWKKYPQRNSMKDSFSLELEKGIYSYWKS